MPIDISSRNFAIIGAGNLGVALMKGLIDGGVPPGAIHITNRRAEQSEALAAEFGVAVAKSNAAAADGADIVLLAVKPQTMPTVLADLRSAGDDPLFISVAAGVSSLGIETGLGRDARVIRAMPNTPALVKESATGIAAGQHASADDLSLAVSIFGRIGITVVVDEALIDAVTGLSGSGPAYVMLFIEALTDAGAKVGLPNDVATRLAVQTLKGSARLLEQTDRTAAELRAQVTSPGGTTIAGLGALEKGGLKATIMDAVEAATARAKELGGG